MVMVQIESILIDAIRIPYPFQFGAPTFNAGEAFAMMAASFVALVGSFGTYNAVSGTRAQLLFHLLFSAMVLVGRYPTFIEGILMIVLLWNTCLLHYLLLRVNISK